MLPNDAFCSCDTISRLLKMFESAAKYLLIAWEETKYDMFEGHQRVNNKSVRWTNHLNNIWYIEHTTNFCQTTWISSSIVFDVFIFNIHIWKSNRTSFEICIFYPLPRFLLKLTNSDSQIEIDILYIECFIYIYCHLLLLFTTTLSVIGFRV